MASKKVSWAVIDLRQGSKVFIFFCCCWWEYPGRVFHDAGFSTEEAICGKWSLQRQVQFFNFSVKHGKKFFRLHFWVIRIGSCSTFVLWRLKSIAFKLFVDRSPLCRLWPRGFIPVCRVRRSIREIGRNVVVASKSGPVETRPTGLVAAFL